MDDARTADDNARLRCGERSACAVTPCAVHDGRLLAVLAELGLGLGSTFMSPPPTRVTDTVPPAPRGRSQQVEIRPQHA